jgi:hypothetical protein
MSDMLNCSTCCESIRRESFLIHYKIKHSNDIFKEIFNIMNDENDIPFLQSKNRMKEVISVLENGIPFELDDEVFVDFEDKLCYKKYDHAVKNINKHSEKHIEAFITFLNLNSLTKTQILILLKFMVNRPTIKEVIKTPSDYKSLCEMREKYTLKLEQDDSKELEKYKKIYSDMIYIKQELQYENNNLKHELDKFSSWETNNLNLFQREKELMDVYDKLNKQVDKKVKQEQDKCDIKLRKLNDELQSMKEKYEKQEKKLKKQNKKLEKEIKYLKSKNDSDSDSDSDDDKSVSSKSST